MRKPGTKIEVTICNGHTEVFDYLGVSKIAGTDCFGNAIETEYRYMNGIGKVHGTDRYVKKSIPLESIITVREL